MGNGKPIVFVHTGLQTGLLDFEFQREYFGHIKNYYLLLMERR